MYNCGIGNENKMYMYMIFLSYYFILCCSYQGNRVSLFLLRFVILVLMYTLGMLLL